MSGAGWSWLALGVAALVAGVALIARGLGPVGGDFAIRLGPGERVEVSGRVPRSKVPAIRAFFRDQPGGVPVGRIVGRFGPGGTPRLRFSGRIDAGLRQRARNFLIEHLR